MSASPQRVFIGWDRPILQQAADRLHEQFACDGIWDLRAWLIVLPSSLAKRRLQEILANRAEHSDCVLYPPDIVTVGQLPEHLYLARFPFASDKVQVLAWCRALQRTDPRLLEGILPLPPRGSAPEQWLELGRLLAGVHRELASDQLNFTGVVQALGNHPEAARWQALAAVQSRYLEVLDSLELWDVQTARLVALQLGEPKTDRQILMLSTVDLNRAQRGFLAAVAENVHVWVAAPENISDHFDEYGCLIGSVWEQSTLTIPPDALLVGNSPNDQFELTAGCFAELGNRFHARDVTLGVPDPSLIPLLEQHLSVAGLQTRFGPGSSLSQSEPAQLLRLVGNYLQQRNYSDFAALIRHPVMRAMIGGQPNLEADWLSKLDQYTADALPRTVETWTNNAAKGADVYGRVIDLVNLWCDGLSDDPRPLDQWVEPLLELLKKAYVNRVFAGDNQEGDERAGDVLQGERLIWACRSVSEHIASLADIPAPLTLSLSASEVIDTLVQAMTTELVPRPALASAVEILGWLDLTLDDAPVLILTGIHDGVVPECVNADPFLPNQLRRQLGMIDNSRRYARDMYAFQVLLNSREHVRIVVGRTSLSGDPLVPSRLLLACKLDELPARVLRLTSDEQLDALPEVRKRWQGNPGAVTNLPIPSADARHIPPRITVTAFRTYIACPYRFYLKHVCHLKSFNDLESELSAGQFGDLVHDTLHRMHLDAVIDQSADPEAIAAFLNETVAKVAVEKYGPSPAAAIRVQIAQAQDRLATFALKQAEIRADGWVTRHVEVSATLAEGETLAGQPLPLQIFGRIDRIDYHPESGRWAIWDYKTSDGGAHPVRNHFHAKTGWTDLQLPLYRHLVRSLRIQPDVQVGYILLPKSGKDIGFVPANFTAEQLQSADEEALRIVVAVSKGTYEPRTTTAIDYDDFARICQFGTQQTTPPRPVRRQTEYPAARRSVILADTAIVAQAEQRLRDPGELARRTAASPSLPPRIIRASAGTGKTYQLSNRLLQIILSGQSVDHVLATTFTRKAAGEILQRVLVRLARACIDTHALHELQKAIGELPFDQADCLAALRRVTQQLHRFRVSTLDSFYAQIARTFSLELQLAPGWSAIDPVREAAVRMQAIQRMLDQSDQTTLTNLVRMLAKGETKRSIAREIEETVQGGFHYYRAATADAFHELVVPRGPNDADLHNALDVVQNFESGHKSIVKAQQALVEFAKADDWEAVVAQSLMKAAVTTQKFYSRELSSKLLDQLAVVRRKCAAELLPIRRAQSTAAYELLHSFNTQYLTLLRSQRLLAFADITYLLSRWMNSTLDTNSASRDDRAQPSLESSIDLNTNGGNGTVVSASEAVLNTVATSRLASENLKPGAMISVDRQQLMLRLDCGIEHLLLDEFQDTAPDQWRIIEPLAKPLTVPVTASRSFFCVGDTKQAIYGWRGGVAEIFDTVTSSVSNLEEAELNVSYRSSQEVIGVVNEVFTSLLKHDNYAECSEIAGKWCEQFPTHHTTRSDMPGYVLVKNGIARDAEASKEERDAAELRYSAEMIAALAAEAPGRSIGVLFRENRKVAMMIELLRLSGVSASQEGGNPLTDSAAVQLILSLVHLADHPGDSIAAFHVQNSPLIELLPESARGTPSAIADWVWSQVTTLGLGRAVALICDGLAPQLSWWDQHRLTQLITLAFQFETQFTNRLRDFELFVEEQKVALPSEAQVKVMTIHSSKGLEFDAVFLPDLGIPLAGHPPLMVARSPDPCAPPSGILRHMNEQVQTLLPKAWQEAFHDRKAQGVREILCVLYVAMTRARSALYMITAPRSAKASNGTQSCESLLQSVLGTPEQAKIPEMILVEKGDAQWYRHTTQGVPTHSVPRHGVPAQSSGPEIRQDGELMSTKDSMAAARVVPAQIALDIDAARAPRRGMRVTAPSSMATRRDLRLDQLFTTKEMFSASVGTLIHACFQQVEWIENFAADDATLRSVVINSLTPEQVRHLSIETEIANFRRMLELDSVKHALSSQRYNVAVSPNKGTEHSDEQIVVENERRISLILNDNLIEGSIDRLVIRHRGGRPYAAEIIDFKTDRWNGHGNRQDWIDERVAHHRPQLLAYAEVVSRMLKLPSDKIDCSLLLLSGDVCIRCDQNSEGIRPRKTQQLKLAF